MSDGSVPYRNAILSALPADELNELRPHLQPVRFVIRQLLTEIGHPTGDVYFPESALISMTADTQDNGLVEVGMIGREGFLGVAVVLSPRALATHRTFVQVPGDALCMRASALQEAVKTLPVLRDIVFRYVHFLMTQTSQAAACNARHELPERLARWLLMSLDRIDGNSLPMTQEFLSYMLGVRRAGVSTVVGTLQGMGLIEQSRGRIVVIDRAGLEAAACSCYTLIEENRQAIMGWPALSSETVPMTVR